MKPVHDKAARKSSGIVKKKWGFFANHIGDYMHRWIFKHPWGTIRIHRILRSDAGRDFHDHPFDFVSFILWGGYTEYTPVFINADGSPNDLEQLKQPRRYSFAWRYRMFSIVRRRAETCHHLELKRPAWTLVFSGPYRRKWGFWTENGWVPYDQYEGEA